MNVFVILAAAVAAFIFYHDILFPLVVYPLKARRRKCGSVRIFPSRPLGIPLTLKFFGHVRRETLLQYLAEMDLSRDHKTSMRETLNKWTIATREPENIKALLSTKFKDFSLFERNQRMRPVFGSGIFTQDGTAWKHSRDMLRPQFSREQISRIEHVGHHVDIMIDEIRNCGGRVELQHLFHLMTMDTATEFLFGESVESLKFTGSNTKGSCVVDPASGKKVYSKEFVDSYVWLNRFALERIILNDLDWVANLAHPEHRSHLQIARSFIDHYVYRALEMTRKGDESVKDSYVFSYELAKVTDDPIVIRDQIFNILIAGRDTTASTLSYAFHYLTRHPDEWRKVREDVFSVFPDGDTSSATYEDLRKAKYVQMVIKEVLRLGPPVPLNMRTAVRNTSLPRGGGPHGDQPVFVPKGTTVNYPTYILHRDPSIYGPDANEFKPERWLPENKRPNSPMYSWGYIPFNGGPRICLGQQFALTEIAVTIIKLAVVFENLEAGEDFEEHMLDRYSMTAMVGGNGVPVKLS